MPGINHVGRCVSPPDSAEPQGSPARDRQIRAEIPVAAEIEARFVPPSPAAATPLRRLSR